MKWVVDEKAELIRFPKTHATLMKNQKNLGSVKKWAFFCAMSKFAQNLTPSHPWNLRFETSFVEACLPILGISGLLTLIPSNLLVSLRVSSIVITECLEFSENLLTFELSVFGPTNTTRHHYHHHQCKCGCLCIHMSSMPPRLVALFHSGPGTPRSQPPMINPRFV